ncbi:hypothetical protein ASPFODRAFT_705750, partial [Aspergillus luchuensis CBS 106.47]
AARVHIPFLPIIPSIFSSLQLVNLADVLPLHSPAFRAHYIYYRHEHCAIMMLTTHTDQPSTPISRIKCYLMRLNPTDTTRSHHRAHHNANPENPSKPTMPAEDHTHTVSIPREPGRGHNQKKVSLKQ